MMSQAERKNSVVSKSHRVEVKIVRGTLKRVTATLSHLEMVKKKKKVSKSIIIL